MCYSSKNDRKKIILKTLLKVNIVHPSADLPFVQGFHVEVSPLELNMCGKGV
jgi:hypothetical protein